MDLLRELLLFMAGGATGAAVAVLRGGNGMREPERVRTEETGRYLAQYRNFLNYNGSEEGQERLEDEK